MGFVKSKWFVLSVCCFIIVALVLITYVIFQPTKQLWPAPELTNAARAASFPLYYPAQLPKGVYFIQGSVKPSKEVVIYTLGYDNGKKLFVSTIPKPSNVVFDDFYKRVLNNKSDVLSTQGTAVIGNADGQNIGSLVTDKSWVTINTSSHIDKHTLETLLSSLKPL